jgi:catechol 2,3-dioxygenase-like lactoylglutathione lyase family enzyme
MRRFHVHLGVPDLAAGIRFYSGLFGQAPAVAQPDYAKWMLDDPRVNFAISQRGARTGLDHLGLQADSAEELAELRTRFAAADADAVRDETDVSCCYARSNKHWVRDPLGIPWEAFHSLGTVPIYGDAAAATDEEGAGNAAAGACCAPQSAAASCCAPSSASAPAKAARSTCCG